EPRPITYRPRVADRLVCGRRRKGANTMARFGVGVMHNTINSRFGPKPLVHADYAIGLACGADSFWVADHLNSVLPPSMWTPKHVGAARLIPKMDAHLEPWTSWVIWPAATGSAG